MNPHESHRHAIDAQRPSEYGGGRCTLLVRRLNDQIELLFHATPETGAIMTPTQAVEIGQALIAAAEIKNAEADRSIEHSVGARRSGSAGSAGPWLSHLR